MDPQISESAMETDDTDANKFFMDSDMSEAATTTQPASDPVPKIKPASPSTAELLAVLTSDSPTETPLKPPMITVDPEIQEPGPEIIVDKGESTNNKLESDATPFYDGKTSDIITDQHNDLLLVTPAKATVIVKRDEDGQPGCSVITGIIETENNSNLEQVETPDPDPLIIAAGKATEFDNDTGLIIVSEVNQAKEVDIEMKDESDLIESNSFTAIPQEITMQDIGNAKIIASFSEPTDKKGFICLVCSTLVDHQESDEAEIDYNTLSLIYRVDMMHEDPKITENQEKVENQFCMTCIKEISLLNEYHVNMKKAVSQFESQRDKLATGMLETYLVNQEEQTGPIIHPHRTLLKTNVLEKWKGLYTGKEDREQEIQMIVKQRELRTVKLNKRIAKVKSSLRMTRNLKDTNHPAKSMAQIQRAMTAAYFTPKLSILRKKNKLFFKVPVVTKTDTKFVCPICDEVFTKKDTMTIHTRSHVAATGKLYKCSICEKICSDRQKLIQHRKEHTEDQVKMKCTFCNKFFYRKGALRHHLRNYHSRDNFTCTVCDKKFASGVLLKRHTIMHSNIDFSVTDMFTCKTCSKTFLKSKDLTDHLRIHEDSTVLGCDFCGKAFSNNEEFKTHLAIHQGGNPYICESEGCSQRFSSEALLVSHLKVHRPKDFTCEKCGKSCRSRDGLRKHELTHTGVKPFSCHVCDVGFIERKSYDAHMVKHTGKLPYKCGICKSEDGFKDAKDLRKHKVVKHYETLPQDKKWACDVCWHGFPSTEAVSDHVAKIHERYKCQMCNRVFKLGDHLRRHMYIHTGEKPYPCTLCTKSFNQESNLKEHMYRHTGTRPHRCPFCPDVGYLRRMHLKEHMMKEHGTDKVPTLPMGRAAHNARKTGPTSGLIFEQQDAILPDVYTTHGRIETVTTAAPEILYSGIGGSSVYLKNAIAQQKVVGQVGQSPLIMRTVQGNKAQNVQYVQRIPQPVINIQGRKPNDIPTINIKSDANMRYSVEGGDPNQQYIILL